MKLHHLRVFFSALAVAGWLSQSTAQAQQVTGATGLDTAASAAPCEVSEDLIFRTLDDTASVADRSASVRAMADCRSPLAERWLTKLARDWLAPVRGEALRGLILLSTPNARRTVRDVLRSPQAVSESVMPQLAQMPDTATTQLLYDVAYSPATPMAVRLEAARLFDLRADSAADDTTGGTSTARTRQVRNDVGWVFTGVSGAATGAMVLATVGALREREGLIGLGATTGALIGGGAGVLAGVRRDIGTMDGVRTTTYTATGLLAGWFAGREADASRPYPQASLGLSALGSTAGLTLGLLDRNFDQPEANLIVVGSAALGAIAAANAAGDDALSTSINPLLAAGLAGGALWGRLTAGLVDGHANYAPLALVSPAAGVTLTLLHGAGRDMRLGTPSSMGLMWTSLSAMALVPVARAGWLTTGESLAIGSGSLYGISLGSGLGLMASDSGQHRTVQGLAAAGGILGAGTGYWLSQYKGTDRNAAALATGSLYGSMLAPGITLLALPNGDARTVAGASLFGLTTGAITMYGLQPWLAPHAHPAGAALGTGYGAIMGAGLSLLATDAGAGRAVGGSTLLGAVGGAALGAFALPELDDGGGSRFGLAYGTLYGVNMGAGLALLATETDGKARVVGSSALLGAVAGAGIGAVALHGETIRKGTAAALPIGSAYGTTLGAGVSLLATRSQPDGRVVGGVTLISSVAGASLGYATGQMGWTSRGGATGMALGTLYGIYHGPALAAALSQGENDIRSLGGIWLTNVALLGVAGHFVGHAAHMGGAQFVALSLSATSGVLLGSQIANAGGAEGGDVWMGSLIGGDIAMAGAGIALLAADVPPIYGSLGATFGLAGAAMGAFAARMIGDNTGETLSTGTAVGLVAGTGAGCGVAYAVLRHRAKKSPERSIDLAPSQSRSRWSIPGFELDRVEPLALASATSTHAATPMGLQIVLREVVR